jgi:2,3-dihydroxybenzoate decarboxylase
MRYIALEEAFSIPGLPERQPSLWPGLPLSQRHLADWARRLPDFTEYRLPEMDAAGINVQVLSLTGPGLQADIDPAAARDDRGTPASNRRCQPRPPGDPPPGRPR